MLAVQFGIFCISLLLCCNKSQADGSLVVHNRTGVALAGELLHFRITVNIPANNTGVKVSCLRNNKEIWMQNLKNTQPTSKNKQLWANITMHNSSSSGEYCFHYLKEKCYLVVLVRDVGYIRPDEHLESDVIPLLLVTTILLLFSIAGSAYVFKWHKDHPESEEAGDGGNIRNRENNVTMTAQSPNSESVYTALEPRPVSIYDVLNVDQVRRQSTEKRTSKEMVEASKAEEGIFESVYENL